MQDRIEKLPIIFAKEKLDAISATVKLTSNGAPFLNTKALWLLRESSVPGLLTVTFFNKDEKEYQNRRIGFVEGKWMFGPKDKEEAVYFAKSAEAAFKSQLPENSAGLLFIFLKKDGFSIQHMMRPEPDEVTKTSAYRGYVLFDDESENEDEKLTSTTRSLRW